MRSDHPLLAIGLKVTYDLTNDYGQPAMSVSDLDGHFREWGFDGSQRVITTQEKVSGPPNALNLVSNASWDSNNNLIASWDPRANAPGAIASQYETDYA